MLRSVGWHKMGSAGAQQEKNKLTLMKLYFEGTEPQNSYLSGLKPPDTISGFDPEEL